MKSMASLKEEIEPYLRKFEVKYKLESREFGELNHVEFTSRDKGGEIDFWSTGWLGILLVDYVKGKELLNVFIEPEQEEEKQDAVRRLQELLK
jgi:hypothetical protein